MQSYISTSTAALLTGEDRRRVFEKITDGVYETRKQRGDRGGGFREPPLPLFAESGERRLADVFFKRTHQPPATICMTSKTSPSESAALENSS